MNRPAAARLLALLFLFLASATLVFFMRSAPTRRVESAAGTFHELKAGLRIVLGSRVLAGVVATGSVAMFGLAR